MSKERISFVPRSLIQPSYHSNTLPNSILYRPLKFTPEAQKLADANNFELAGYIFEAEKESTRSPRVVRIGLIQNAIISETSEDVVVQRDSLYQRVASIIEAASLAGVNVLCFQEAWSEF